MKEVGILLKVGAAGLEKINELGKGLRDAGVDTAALDARAAALGAELSQLRVKAGEAGAGTRELGTAQAKVRSDATAAAAAVQALQTEYQQAGAAARQSAATQAAASGSVKDSLKGVGDQLRTIQSLAGAAIGGQLLGGLAGQVSQTADAYKNLESRIKLVTGEGAAFDAAFKGVFEIAKRTNSELAGTGELFTRIASAGKLIGVSQQDALRLTETINQSVQLSGASAEASRASITQLIQGLQSGALRGDEFNSVMEQAPRLAKALADGLGVTTGELRKQAEQGQLTSEVVIKALQGQAAAVEGEFSRLPATVGRAIQNLSTEWTRYVGEVDKANGVSAAAASAINLLANNLDTLGALLFAAGKAAAAYQVLNLAQTFMAKATAVGVATAAVTSSTVATRVHTVATVADTAATVANTAATAGRAGAASMLAGALSSLKLFSLIGVVTNLQSIGTAIGETAAKWMGYGKGVEEAEAKMRAEEEASRKNAQAKAALGAAMQATSDKALGLNKESKALVAVFDDARTKGDSVSESLEKLQKELKLGDITGITNAVTALDVLEQKGKITGAQVRDALAGALKGVDLGIFAANAVAAFDKSEQGARRLKGAMDALANESLTRAGTSVQELKTGFSTAMNSAINDTDALAKTLKDMGVKGEEAGALLAKSVDKEVEAAKTERALEAVRNRLVELGAQGLVSADKVVDGLTKIQKKADDAKGGINSLAEAYRALGLKSKQELDKMAADNLAAWTLIKNDATASLAIKQEAFKKYAETAVTAEGGVARATMQVQAQALGLQIQFSNTGKAAVSAMGQADEGLKRTRREVRDTTDAVVAMGSAFDRTTKARSDSLNSTPFKSASPTDQKTGTIGSIYTPPPDNSGDYYWTATTSNPGGAWLQTPAAQQRDFEAQQAKLGLVKDQYGIWRRSTATPNQVQNTVANRGAGTSGMSTTGANQVAAANGGSYTVNVTIGGKTTAISAANQSSADALVEALREAHRAAGGGG